MILYVTRLQTLYNCKNFSKQYVSYFFYSIQIFSNEYVPIRKKSLKCYTFTHRELFMIFKFENLQLLIPTTYSSDFHMCNIIFN